MPEQRQRAGRGNRQDSQILTDQEGERKERIPLNTFVYKIGEALYINLTNRCTNRCDFCVRKEEAGVGGYNLWLDQEPGVWEVLDLIPDPAVYQEIVFCGYGEPMLRLDEIVAISAGLKERDPAAKIRINTNGQANLVHGYNVVPGLKGLIDVVSISLNAPDRESYQKMCRSDFGAKAFDGLLDFTRDCVKVLPRVILSVVDVLSLEDIEKCRKIARDLGAEFRVRKMIE